MISLIPDDANDEQRAEWRDAATKKDEPVVHVKVTPTGEWHRMAIDLNRTACGLVLGVYATRDASYAGDLCKSGCFSGYELMMATRLREAVEQARDLVNAEYETAAARQKDDMERARAANRRRLEEATGKHLRIERPLTPIGIGSDDDDNNDK